MDKIKTLPSLRQHNQHAVLQLIFEKQYSSRTELSKLLHMSKPAVTDNLLPLLELGIVQEIGEGSATKKGGRKPIILQFNPNFKYIVAIDLNFKKPIFSLGNLGGTIINQFALNVPEKITCETRISLVKNAINILLNSNDVQPENLAYIILSIPGIIRNKDQKPIYNAQFKPWFDCNFPKTLQAEYGVTTLLRNDVKMATMGEFYFGSGKGYKNLFYISCGIGLGSAFILNNNLYEGLHQASGGIERFVSFESSQNQKNLEELISIDGLINRLAELSKNPPDKESSANIDFSHFDDVVEAYQNKNILVCNVIDEIGKQLGYSISNICNLLDIDQVILGGEYLVFQEQLIPIIQKIVNQNTLFDVDVKAATLGRNSGTFGMFETIRQIYFKSICQQ